MATVVQIGVNIVRMPRRDMAAEGSHQMHDDGAADGGDGGGNSDAKLQVCAS